jgi:hypothetical protein
LAGEVDFEEKIALEAIQGVVDFSSCGWWRWAKIKAQAEECSEGWRWWTVGG